MQEIYYNNLKSSSFRFLIRAYVNNILSVILSLVGGHGLRPSLHSFGHPPPQVGSIVHVAQSNCISSLLLLHALIHRIQNFVMLSSMQEDEYKSKLSMPRRSAREYVMNLYLLSLFNLAILTSYLLLHM